MFTFFNAIHVSDEQGMFVWVHLGLDFASWSTGSTKLNLRNAL